MATSTERFGFTKPAGSDPASVVPLNSNTDLIELYLGRTQDMIAPLYDDTATYEVDDIVTYESRLYKCITAISTAETFDPTKWEATTAVEEGSGGGGGSSVIPNPTGTPTDTLSTIGIDGTIYGIEGGGSISGEGVEIYSEDEYIVGKWIDGKKVYQKTFDKGSDMSISNSSWEMNVLTIANIENVVECFGISSTGTSYPLNAYHNGDNVNLLACRDGNPATVRHITIRYTKTVETPAPAWGGSVTNNYANFIDTDNVIQAFTQISDTSEHTYTATEDCIIVYYVASQGDTFIKINNVLVGGNYSQSVFALCDFVAVKKGQTFSFQQSYAGSSSSGYTVYGITYASGGSETPATDASEVEYDNTTSQLTADNVQDAIDEVVANADTASEDILTLQNVQGYDAYDETQTYAVGDYAIYNNHVYECTTAVSTAEPFDSTKWSQTSIEQIIDGVKGDVSQLNSRLPSDDSWINISGNTYYCIYNGIVFVRINNLSVTSRTTLDIGTLPVGYRPSIRIEGAIVGGGYREYVGDLYVGTDGGIHVYSNTSANYWGMLSFPIVSAP